MYSVMHMCKQELRVLLDVLLLSFSTLFLETGFFTEPGARLAAKIGRQKTGSLSEPSCLPIHTRSTAVRDLTLYMNRGRVFILFFFLFFVF